MESAFGPDGLTHDREFLVVDAANVAMTQRTVPRMALIETALAPDALILRAPGMEELRVPRDYSVEPGNDRPVTIWRDTVQAADAGDVAAGWFTRVLGQPCRLVRRGAAYTRLLPERRVPEHLRAQNAPPVPVAFADAFPLLVVSEESLADLNQRLEEPLPMDRFRPNLVVRGCPAPYAEDNWAIFQIGERAVLHAGGTCERCVMTTIDQETAMPQGKEPLRTLALYRPAGGEGHGVIFGQNVIPQGAGQLHVGDRVEVTQSKE